MGLITFSHFFQFPVFFAADDVHHIRKQVKREQPYHSRRISGCQQGFVPILPGGNTSEFAIMELIHYN